ncbi:hypothetical protein JI735_11550 [Paenibacillus sonchi]|uniref:Uncharacterized protein n=1 Tax=Paenibacillus sonchi TaxID=373687 RepID=A0A974PFW6_9BACL|nr:hypothetical protein [Paenibacillus sonchi]QQZ63065.1 hypothetical protein JI735_11550 [Paenibacillus sonchi]
MSMYKSHVVTGRILEIHADRVLTQQGEMLCTFHPRYYMLPDVETWTPEKCDLKEEPWQYCMNKAESGAAKGAGAP